MEVFRNLLVVFILMGVVTRIELWLIQKRVKKTVAVYVSFFISLVIFIPIAAIAFGFDVAFFEYGTSLIFWLIFDLLRLEKNKRRER